MRLGKTALFVFFAVAFWASGVAHAADKTVGVVLTGDLARYREANKAFQSALAKAGFDQSKVQIFVQTPNPDAMSWTNSVRKFVGVEADVIVAFGAPATLAALKETSSIPVVFSYVYDPDSCGVKRHNSTGVSSKVPMVTLLKTLKSITPFNKLAVIYNPGEKDSVVQLEDVKKNAAALGFQVVEVSAKSSGEAKGKVAKSGADCVYITCSAAVDMGASGVVSAAHKGKMPTATLEDDVADAGVLLALAPSASEQGELAAKQVAKILKGGSPSEQAVENPKKVDLVVNLKAAGTLDLKVPFDVLNAATRVIK